MDIVTQYKTVAKEFATQYQVQDEHIINIISSVMMTRDKKGYPGGGFVQAVIDNDLFDAINKADDLCYQYLKVIVAAKRYAYLPNHWVL